MNDFKFYSHYLDKNELVRARYIEETDSYEVEEDGLNVIVSKRHFEITYELEGE